MENTKPKPKLKPKIKSDLAAMFSRMGHESMTPEQRQERSRRANAARWHKTKPTTYYGLIALPVDYVWKGTAHAAKVLDAAVADTAQVLFWSSDKAEVIARSQEPDLRSRATLIIEQDWNPLPISVKREYSPNNESMEKLLKIGGTK